MATDFIQATGRRKSSIARIRMVVGGDGNITVNDRTLEDYLPRDVLRALVFRPLMVTEKSKLVSFVASVNGGGIASQAGAITHGISRALIKWDPTLRGALKKEGLLTRDPRMKERKKYGQKGARKRFQYSKR